MAKYVKYEKSQSGYVFKVEADGGRAVRMVSDKFGTRFEFFTFGPLYLSVIQTSLKEGAMTEVSEYEYLATLKRFLQWNVEIIEKLDKITIE